jgi:hypothetical protein
MCTAQVFREKPRRYLRSDAKELTSARHPAHLSWVSPVNATIHEATVGPPGPSSFVAEGSRAADFFFDRCSDEAGAYGWRRLTLVIRSIDRSKETIAPTPLASA